MRRGVGERRNKEGKEVYGRAFDGGGAIDFGGSGFAEKSGVLGVGLYQLGTGVVGGFGHGAQDIHMISWS